MNVLATIFATKREEVAHAKRLASLEDLRALAREAPPTRGFLEAVSGHSDLALIAEVKKASPSKGVIREPFDAAEIARTYRHAGANALSVLTDRTFFQGSPENLVKAREATGLPVLRKDFIEEPYQIYQARAWGADAILLIASWLCKDQLEELTGLADELDMDALVEVHTEAEAAIADELGSPLVGVNNRDLAEFVTDLSFSERILPLLTKAKVRVSESALKTRADLDRVKAAGADAVLIGTTFCASPDIEEKVHEVMGR